MRFVSTFGGDGHIFKSENLNKIFSALCENSRGCCGVLAPLKLSLCRAYVNLSGHAHKIANKDKTFANIPHSVEGVRINTLY